MGIICRWDSIEESCYLRPQITDHNKLFQNIFGQNVGVSSFFDVIWTDINMIGSQMQVGSRNGTHSPFRFGGKGIGFVVACGTKKRKSMMNFLLKWCLYFSFLPYLKLTQLKKRAWNNLNSHIKISNTYIRTDEKTKQKRIGS